MNRKTFPNPLWWAIFSLSAFSIIHLRIGLYNPVQLFPFAINIVLILGLLRLAKWSYFLAILASILGPTILLFEAGSIPFYFVLLLNCTVLIPVLICTKVFFPQNVKHAHN